MGRKVLSISLPEELIVELKSRAESEGLSLSKFVEKLLREALKERKPERIEVVEIPTDLEARIARIEAEIRAIWKKFEELEEEETMKEIFQGFSEFLEQREQEGEED